MWVWVASLGRRSGGMGEFRPRRGRNRARADGSGGRASDGVLAPAKQRAHFLGVLADDPGDYVGHSLPGRMRLGPELEIGEPVVMPHAVAMVHRFVGPEPAAAVISHHELVLATDGAVDLDAPVSLWVEPAPSRERREMRAPFALGAADRAARAQALVVQGAVAARAGGAGQLSATVDRA